MVFHVSLSISKSPQSSRILLSILSDLTNAVVRMVSAHPPISNSSSPLIKPWRIVSSAPITIGITVTFMFHSFLVLRPGLSTFLFSLIFTVVYQTAKFISWQVLFSFTFFFSKSSGQDQVICLYLKIPENLVHLILQDGFWFVHTMSASNISKYL